jgi:polyisoprenoid-binding protein YceI
VSRYVIDPERSHVQIEARSNVHPIHSSTDGLKGYIELEFSPGGAVDLAAPVAGQISLAVDLLSSGNRLEDRELQRRINARRYPTIEGSLGKVAQSDPGETYRVSGDVNFRGVSCHHEDAMQISRLDDQTIQLAGQSKFDIREFGMEPPRMLMMKVEPEVEIRVEIFAVRESAVRESAVRES